MKLLPHRVWFRKTVANQGRRGFGADVLTCIALVVLMATRTAAAVHPVPLPSVLSAMRTRPRPSPFIPP